MSTINVKRNVQFEPDLFKKTEHREWLDAVGMQLEAKGVSIELGVGANTKTVKNAAELQAAMKELKASSTTAAAKAYVTDLLQAIDDVVKGDAQMVAGDAFDFSQTSGAAKALGFDDLKPRNYAASTTEFGKAARTKPEGTMTIDAVTYQVTGAVRPPPPPAPGGIDLTRIPHMSTESLANAPIAYGREGEEVEDTRVITGLTTAETVALATSSLDDLARPRAAVGLTLGVVPLDEMTWDSDSHALRRANPYVSFSLDGRSFELNPNSGQPRVGIGRDFFYDTFMAKKNLTTGELTKDLQKADLMFRTRIRYGSDRDPFAGTRVLVGMKEGTSIDPDGTKHARKIDNRTDSANQAVFDTLTSIAQTGKIDASWGWGAGDVAPAASAMYRVALQKGVTDDIGGSTGVLALEPGAVARQIRARFHLNESRQNELLQGFRDAGEPKVKELVELITAAPDWAASGATLSKTALLAQGMALLDRSAIVTAATEGLHKLTPGVTVDKALIDSLWPGQPITTREQAKMQRVVADAIRSQYDAFAENIDLAQREIGGTTDRAVRDAGPATEVRNYLRQKSAVARFMAAAEADPATTNVVIGQPATYTAYAKTLIDMPAGREKNDLLQSIGVGLNQLGAMTDESFSSPVKIDAAIGKRQTLGAYIAQYDAALAGPNREAFITELANHLAEENSATLASAAPADKDKVLGDIRKNLVTAHTEILHRMVEGAGAWGQAIWFNNYRQTMLRINPQGWNFVIGSMDYSEFYDAKTGGELSFADRVSRRPLDPAKMTGAMISNDFQIELQAEEGYTAAIRRAQYGINGAAAGLMMDYALSKNVPGVTAGNAESFEQWFSTQAKLPAAQRKNFVDEVNAFAQSKGSPIDVSKVIDSLDQQEQAIRVLAAFAKVKDPTLNIADRQLVESYYRTQASLPEEALNTFLTEVARYAAAQKSEVALSPNLLRTLDFKPFAPANVNQPVAGHATLLEDFNVSNEVWSMVKQSQRDLSAARGADVQRVLRDNNLRGKTWEPPTKAKGDYAIDFAIAN